MDIFRAQDAASKAVIAKAMVADGYDNFLNKVGLLSDNTLSAGTYDFNLITRNRVLLEAAYRGSWIVGQVVDTVADDMTRAGITITTAAGNQFVNRMQKAIARKHVWRSMNFGEKWGRLYGGGLGVIQIEGQDPKTPLNLETIGRGQFQGIVAYDRWLLNPVLSRVIQSGPDMGLPEYYQIVTGLNSAEPVAETPTGEITVHHSRCIRFTGIDLPYFQAITEMMWGESILERLWDRLIAFDNATMSCASLIDRANLRTVGVNGLRQIIASGGEAEAGLTKMFDMMRFLQVNEGLTIIDKDDSFATTAYSFAGLSDMMLQFGQQLAGASGIPLVRLFGQSPAGLSSTGEGDIRMYYDNINAQQEAKLGTAFEKILKIIARSETGEAPPDDMEYSFNPLWQTSEMDKANIAKTTAETVIGAFDAGLLKKSAAMEELRATSGNTGLFSNITEEDIAEAEELEDNPPVPGINGEIVPEGSAQPGEKPPAPVPSLSKEVPKLGASATPQDKKPNALWK
jgi:uncharacterized protein